MGFINTRMGDAPEVKVASEGMYDLHVIRAELQRTKKDDRDMISVGIAIEGPEDYEILNQWFVLPNEDDWEEENGRKAKMFLRNLKRFLHVFGIEWSTEGFELESLEGAAGKCLVTTRTNEDTGQVFNDLRLPRLPEDAE